MWSGGCARWECDTQDHMNVRFHVAKAMEGMASLVAEMGLPHAFSAHSPSTVDVADIFIRFLREAHAGGSLYMTGGVVELGETDARLLLVLRHPAGEPASAYQVVVRHVAVADGRPLPWPERVRNQAPQLKVETPTYAAPRTLTLEPSAGLASLERALELKLPRISLTVLTPADCDVFGRMRPEIFIGRIGDGMPRLLRKTPAGAQEQRRIGGAAVEYRLAFFQRPRPGDRIELRSGVIQQAERYRRTAHWLLDPDSGRAWGVAANVGIRLDLQTRKTLPFTPDVVAEEEGAVVAGMSF